MNRVRFVMNFMQMNQIRAGFRVDLIICLDHIAVHTDSVSVHFRAVECTAIVSQSTDIH